MYGFSTILGFNTIGKMNVVNGVTEVSTINSTITADAINYVNNLVENSLAENKDPINFVKFKNGHFSLSENTSNSSFSGCIGNPNTCPTNSLPFIPTISFYEISINGNTKPSPLGGCIGDSVCPTPTSLPTSTPTATPIATPTPIPIGEFRVNTYFLSDQSRSKIAYNPDGSFIVTWTSSLQDGNQGAGSNLSGVYAQRFNSSGMPQGSEFRVNTYITNNQSRPSITSLTNGDFIITWQSELQDGNSYGIYAQRYNSSGIPQGSEFKVSTYTTGSQSLPSIASASNGDFIITWQSGDGQPSYSSGYNNQDGNLAGIFAQRFNSSGIPQGSELQVNTYTTGNQVSPSIASASNGDFIITWASLGQDGSQYGVYAQRYNSLGIKQGTEFRVNTYTSYNQMEPSIDSDPNGNFIIVWRSDNQDNGGTSPGVYAQRYDSSGSPQGSDFRVNTYVIGGQYEPSVAMDSTGNFVVTWTSEAQDGDNVGIFAQRYNNSGTPQGSEFQANTYINSSQRYSSIKMNSNGNFIITWSSSGQDTNSEGVYAKRYNNLGIAQ